MFERTLLRLNQSARATILAVQDSGCRWDNLFRISLRYGLQSSLINILVEWTNGNGNGLAFNLSVTAKSGRGGFELRWIAKNSVAAIFSQPLWPRYLSPSSVESKNKCTCLKTNLIWQMYLSLSRETDLTTKLFTFDMLQVNTQLSVLISQIKNSADRPM